MTNRLNYAQYGKEQITLLTNLSAVARKSLGNALVDLVELRSSQLNHCAFCVDMHSKEAIIHGERPLRLLHVPVWRESPLFDARERAALNWAEEVTKLGEHGVSDAAYTLALEHFSEKELTDLTFAIASINAWNRLGVSFQPTPGSLDKYYGLDKAGLK